MDVDITLFTELFNMVGKILFTGVNLDDLKLSKLEILITIAVAANEGIAMTDLANEIGTSKVQISRTIDSLEKKEFVQRKHNKKNRRMVNVFLTENGREAFRQKQQQVKAHIQQELAGLTSEEYQAMNDHLLGMQKILRSRTDRLKMDSFPERLAKICEP